MDDPAVDDPGVDDPGVDDAGVGRASAEPPADARRVRPRRHRLLGALCFLPLAVLTAALHLLAVQHPGDRVATLGEARLAVRALADRGLDLATAPLPFGDQVAAVQLAVVQLALPLAGVPVVDAARWACLVLGALAALLTWPVLRGLGVSVPATAVAVALFGLTLPALTLHAGVSAGAPAAVWLVVAAWLAVRQWGWAAVVAALAAALTAPLAAAALLALGAHLVFAGVLRVPDRVRPLLGGLLGLAALAAAVASVGAGPLAGVAGPLLGGTPVVVGVLGGLVVLGLAWRSADWLRPVLTAAVPLLLAGLVPGPSRVAAALLVAPVLALAVGLLLDHLVLDRVVTDRVVLDRVGGRHRIRALAAVGAVAVLLAAVVPTVVELAGRSGPPARPNALIAWLATEPLPGTVIRADELDRAELLSAGVPADRLRAPGDPAVPGELRLVSVRPTDGGPAPGSTACPGGTVVAAVEHGTGGAPAAVCRTDGGADLVAAEHDRRVRIGAALADNPALRLAPAAAERLRAGEVDPRLMFVLTALTTAHRIGVADFPSVALDSADVPRRQALLSSVDGGDPASWELLQTWLTSQQPPFRPSLTRPDGGGLLVGYPAPPLSGLLPE